LFAELGRDPGLGRAEALRRAEMALAEGDPVQAHPAFWAPFVVVGEGGTPARAATVQASAAGAFGRADR
jgi:hypothetical protein